MPATNGELYFVSGPADAGRNASTRRRNLFSYYGSLSGEFGKMVRGLDPVGWKGALNAAGRGDCFVQRIVRVKLIDILADQVGKFR